MKRIAAAIAIVLSASCTSETGTTASPVASVAPPPTTTAATTESPSFTPAVCPNPEGGPEFNTCLGDLEAGTYHTKTFRPSLTYSVPAGWSNQEDFLGNFLLIPPGGDLAGVNPGTSDYLGVYTSVVAPGLCTGDPSTKIAPTFDGLVGFLTSHPRLTVTNMHNASVGGLRGLVMDIEMSSKKGDGCSDGNYVDVYAGTPPSDLIHGVIPDYRLRVYLLHNGKHTLAIEVADAPRGSRYKDWFAAADEVIDSFTFGTH
jgi:hypothetical protein